MTNDGHTYDEVRISLSDLTSFICAILLNVDVITHCCNRQIDVFGCGILSYCFLELTWQAWVLERLYTLASLVWNEIQSILNTKTAGYWSVFLCLSLLGFPQNQIRSIDFTANYHFSVPVAFDILLVCMRHQVSEWNSCILLSTITSCPLHLRPVRSFINIHERCSFASSDWSRPAWHHNARIPLFSRMMRPAVYLFIYSCVILFIFELSCSP